MQIQTAQATLSSSELGWYINAVSYKLTQIAQTESRTPFRYDKANKSMSVFVSDFIQKTGLASNDHIKLYQLQHLKKAF